MTQDAARRPATWRSVLAAILDFLTAFFVFGYLVGAMTGQLTPKGFKLSGWPAALGLALVVAYFVIGNRIGGTLWKCVLRVPPR